MEVFRIYLLVGSAFILLCDSSPQQVEIREVISALSKIATAGEIRESCKDDYVCLNSQVCKNNTCLDPCPGSCGINALCHVQNHKLTCECPHCYNGDPQVECKRGIFSWLCTF